MTSRKQKIDLPKYTNLVGSIDKFQTFLSGVSDKNNSIRYLPQDVKELILLEYLKTTNILYLDPSQKLDHGATTIFKWFDQNSDLHRDNALPAVVIQNKSNKFIRAMSWYRHGELYRGGDKPCDIEYEGPKGTVSRKVWNNGYESKRRDGFPYRMDYDEDEDIITCSFMNKDDEEYKSSDIPRQYGW